MTDVRKIPAYEALALQIKALGIECTFGLMSDDTAALVATLDAMGVRFFGTRHENAAISMAEGYAAALGKIAVAIIGRGPAMTNGLHGAVYANMTGSKVLIIYGDSTIQNPINNGFGPDNKSFNAVALLAVSGIRTFIATSGESMADIFCDAAAYVQQGRAAALLLPMNLQYQHIAPRASRQLEPVKAKPAARPRSSAIDVAVSVIDRSRKPMIVVGLGAFKSDAKEAIGLLADRIGAIVATTAKAREYFTGNPFNVGIVGSFSHSAGRRLIEEADCVIAFGASMNKHTVSFGTSLPQDAPVIHVDTARTNINRWSSADVAIVGDARDVAERLLAALPARSAAEKPFHTDANQHALASFNPANDFTVVQNARTLDPRAFGVALNKHLPKNRNVVCDAGNFLGVLPYINVPGPSHFKMTSEFASIGMGFGTAMGFAVGRPDAPTLLLIGDGSFLMTLGELETVVREDIPLVIALMNDCAYGAEYHFLKLRDLPVAKAVFPDVDFAPIAESFGFQAATIRSLGDLEALSPLLAAPEGPIFLDCKINASVAAAAMIEGAEHEKKMRGKH